MPTASGSGEQADKSKMAAVGKVELGSLRCNVDLEISNVLKIGSMLKRHPKEREKPW